MRERRLGERGRYVDLEEKEEYIKKMEEKREKEKWRKWREDFNSDIESIEKKMGERF